MIQCAIYARVSDESQVKGDSIEHQISFAKTYIRRQAADSHQEWSTPDDLIYVDEGITGTSMVKRPAVMDLIAHARMGKFQVVIFKGISRFARDTVDALVMLRTLLACGVRVLSIEENFDSQRDSAEFVFTIHSALAQAESEKTAVRVRLGAMEKARTGRWNGRAPDGYRLNPQTKVLQVDEDFAPIIREIFDLYLSGYGCRRIAQSLNERQIFTRQGNYWNQRNISRLLRNPVYAGHVVYGRRTKRLVSPDEHHLGTRKVAVRVTHTEDIVVKEHAHPAIIDQEEFQQVKAKLDGRTKHAKNNPLGKHLLTGGILRCNCGSGMTVKQNGRGTVYYRCSGQMDRGKVYCSQRYIRADWIEQAILTRVHQDIQPILSFEDATFPRRKVGAAHFGRIEQEREQQHKRTQLLFEKYADGTLSSEQFEHMNGLTRQRLTFLAQLESRLKSQSSVYSASADELRCRIERHIDSLFHDPHTHSTWTREILLALVEKVNIVKSSAGGIELSICYRFGR